ncbi:hypothetical protein PHYSODRAFT_301942 [Phytophthora sojae]|nr:hypothetical protein PHYSODRAFT_301942 [Phytophthora sojae]EGZ15417.1 hypothetical protein PHYSODRAFT_301942 [Phytophthora sojae]|eukprot:XP_009529166.1 hypothetical protein PHYSODRAFT_301942 [Phytophthora sojae]
MQWIAGARPAMLVCFRRAPGSNQQAGSAAPVPSGAKFFQRASQLQFPGFAAGASIESRKSQPDRSGRLQRPDSRVDTRSPDVRVFGGSRKSWILERCRSQSLSSDQTTARPGLPALLGGV